MKKIYNKAKVPRIDNFILKLIRNHFASTRSVPTNGLIQGLTYPNPLYFVKTLTSGHIPPEAFLDLDEKGFIQNNKNIPIIYHAIRRAGNTKITFPSNLDMTILVATYADTRRLYRKETTKISTDETLSDIGGWIREFNVAQFVNDLFTFFVYFILFYCVAIWFIQKKTIMYVRLFTDLLFSSLCTFLLALYQ